MADSDAWKQVRAYLAAREQHAEAVADAAADAVAPDPATVPAPSGTPGDDDAPPVDAEAPAARLARIQQLSSRFNVGRVLDATLPTDLVDRVAAVPTPGGLFPLIIALLFFVFAIVPAHHTGATRLQLLWRALTGGAYLPQSPQNADYGAQASALGLGNVAGGIAGGLIGGVGSGIAAATSTVQQDANLLWGAFWGATGGL